MDALSTNAADVVAEEPKRPVGRPPKNKEEKSDVSRETVEIDRSELQALLKRVEKLENPGIIEKVKRVTEHVGYLRGWEEKLVIGIGNMKENPTVPESDINRYELPVTLLSQDGTWEEKKVPYLYFLENSDKYSIKITSMTRVERPEVDPRHGGGGKTSRGFIDKEGRLMPEVSTGETIDLEVTFLDISVKTIVTEGPFSGRHIDFDTAHLNAINC